MKSNSISRLLLSVLFLVFFPNVFANTAPTYTNIKYGTDSRNTMDIYLADSQTPTPVAVFIHGGGFQSGDKSAVHDAGTLLENLLDSGISVVAINYRLTKTSNITLDRILIEDIALSVQFLRSRADSYNIDTTRIGAFGNSAGAGAALWLGVAQDQADSTSANWVKHESSRVSVVGHLAGQNTYDTTKWASLLSIRLNWPTLIDFTDDLYWYGITSRAQIDSPKAKAVRNAVDLPQLMTNDDAAIYIENYSSESTITLSSSMTSAQKSEAKKLIAHSPLHAKELKKQCDLNGLTCKLNLVTTPLSERGTMVDFFVQQFNM